MSQTFENERIEKDMLKNSNQKREGGAILIWHKWTLSQKLLQKNKEGHHVMIKGSIHQMKKKEKQ